MKANQTDIRIDGLGPQVDDAVVKRGTTQNVLCIRLLNSEQYSGHAEAYVRSAVRKVSELAAAGSTPVPRASCKLSEPIPPGRCVLYMFSVLA